MARDRSRRAHPATSAVLRGLAGLHVPSSRRQGRRLRAWRRPGRGRPGPVPAPTACASPPSTRPWRFGPAGIVAPIHVLYPIPASGAGDAAAGRAIGHRRRRGLRPVACSRPSAACRPGSPSSPSRSRSRRAWAAAGVVVERRAGPRPASSCRRRLRPVALWTHLQAPEDPDLHRDPARPVRRGIRIARSVPAWTLPRHVSASAGVLTGIVPPYEGVRPGPGHLRPDPG